MKLYELAAADGRRFSPFCWRTRLALALKGMSAEAVPVEFLAIPGICGGTGKSVPTLELDDGEAVVDSFEIARRLDELQPDKPLFRGSAAQAHCRTIEGWANVGVAMQVRNLVIVDIWAAQSPDNRAYFRDSREKRFGSTLEDLQQGREERVKPFNEVTLAPAAHALAHADWLGGDAPDYADCLVFGSLVWGPVISDFEILRDGPVKDWFRRCCGLLDGEPEIAAVLAKL
jgi:glutathione S-transferase